jgi:hypothetical protein
MANQKLNDILAAMAKHNAANAPLPNFQTVKGLSDAILSSVPIQTPYSSGTVNTPDLRGPSVINRILDLFSRPMYGALNAFKGQMERDKDAPDSKKLFDAIRLMSPITNPSEMHDIWQGLSGKEKTTGNEVIDAFRQGNNIKGDLPGPAKAAASFAIDVLGDPLTYVGGVGLLPKIGKAAKVSTEALKAVEGGSGELAQELARGLAKDATKVAGEKEASLLNPLDKLKALEPELPAKFKPVQLALPAGAPKIDVLNDLKKLHEQIATAKSPITKNILRKQAEKLSEGVNPADVLSTVRTAPPVFPSITIGSRWIDKAKLAAQQFMRTNRMKNINHVGQTNLYNKLVHMAGQVRKDRRTFHVFQMLRIAEDEILSQGRHLVDGEGISVRLSDVANMMGGPKALSSRLVDDFRKARPSQQVEDLKAFTTPQVVTEKLDPVIRTGADIAEASTHLPPSQTMHIGSEVSNALRKIAEDAGASSREAGVAKNFISELFNTNKDRLYTTVQQEARNLVRQTASGKVDPETLL